MTRETLIEQLRRRDALTIAASLRPTRPVEAHRGDPPADWLVDTDSEGPIEAHRQAHQAGTPSVAIVAYGEMTTAEQTAERLVALAALAVETGMLRAVIPIPDTGIVTPGSWGVEDLTVIAVARTVLPDTVRVQPSWERLGAGTCAIALAFGADALRVPHDETDDIVALVNSAGREVVTG